MTRSFATVPFLAAALLALALPSAAGAEGDVARGEKVFARCKACHSVEQGGANRVGPNLWGVFGAKAGERDNGFSYSTAMQDSGIVWDEATMSAYLENPRKVVAGTKMVFAGLKKEDQREDVIAYLRSVTE